MSFAVPVAPAENRRPTIVSAAGYLLYLVAVVIVVNSILPLSSVGKVSDALRQAYANSTKVTPDQVSSFYRIETIGAVVIYVILAVGISILAAFDLRGKQVARIITWVIGGLGVLCLGCGLSLSGRISTSAGSTSSAGEPDPQTVADMVKKAQPSWLVPTSRTLSVIAVLALIVVIILLTLPAANNFFRKPQAQAQFAGAAEPAYPTLAYPPVPGAAATTPAPSASSDQPSVPPSASSDQPPAPPSEEPSNQPAAPATGQPSEEPSAPPSDQPPASSEEPPAPPSDQPPADRPPAS